MAWWGWLIVVWVSCTATGIVVYILARRFADSAQASNALLLERDRLTQQLLDAERIARQAIEMEREHLARQLRVNQKWFDRERLSLTKGTRDEYERLTGDRSVLDRRLDELLSRSASGSKGRRKPPPHPARKG